MSNVEQGIMNVEGSEQIQSFLVPAWEAGKKHRYCRKEQRQYVSVHEQNKNGTRMHTDKHR